MKAPSLGEETFALHLRAEGLTMEREVRFHPKRRWLADFLHRDAMVIVEIEGGTHSNGRHTRGAGFARDCEKYNAATEMGYRVFRYPTEAVTSGEAIAQIKRVLK